MAVHNNHITIAKAIGIILMVIGHSGCPLMLFRFIYLFHMPLFFFCSGIFFKEMLSKNGVAIYLKKRVRGLYIPFVKWAVAFLLLHNLFVMIGIYNSNYGYDGGSSQYSLTDIMQKFFSIIFSMHDYEELLGGFWFIRALFITSLLIALVSLMWRKSYKYKHEILCLFFLALTVLIRRFFPDPEFWRDLSMGAFGAFFYMLGHLVIPYAGYWQNKCGAILCTLILVLSYYYFKDGISMGCGFNKVVPFSVSAISGTMLTLYVSNMIEKKRLAIKSALYYIGNHTLDILALHFLSFRFVNYIIVVIYGINVSHIAEHPVIKDVSVPHAYWWILYCIVGLLLPLLLNYIWNRVVNIIKIIIK